MWCIIILAVTLRAKTREVAVMPGISAERMSGSRNRR